MKVTHGDKILLLSIVASFVQYNCAAKMFGRIKPKVVDEKTAIEVPFSPHLASLFEDNKDQIIKEWGASLNVSTTYDQLKSGGANPIFPNDSGRYLPNVLMYADNINIYEGKKWYNDGRALCEELLNNSKHGFVVMKGPMFSNRYYGYSHFSRIWNVIPPGSVPYLVSNQNTSPKSLQSATKGVAKSLLTKEDFEELKAFGSH